MLGVNLDRLSVNFNASLPVVLDVLVLPAPDDSTAIEPSVDNVSF